jgi:hypothetical protein
VARKITPWEEWKSQVNWEQVQQAILGVEDGSHELTTIDYELAAGMTWDALEHFVPLDKAALNVLGLEKYGEYGPYKTKYVIDVLAEIIEDPIAPYNKYPVGTKVILDWKTAMGNLDSNWSNKYKQSWQGRIYAAAVAAPLIEYRGISQTKDSDDPVQGLYQTKSVPMAVPETNTEQVDEYLFGIQRQVDAYAQLEVYPRRMPKSCGAWGRDCEFKEDCKNYTMPRQRLEMGLQLSFSRIEQLHECPEKYRRMRLQKERSNEGVIIGLAVHRGMANAYSQLWNVPIEERK